MSCLPQLLLLSFGGVFAKPVDQCNGNSSCMSQLDDESLMQVNRVGMQMGQPKGFVLNSQPYLGPEGRSLTGAEAGRIQINEDGVWKTYYLPGANTQDDGKTVRYTPPYRFYLMKTPTTDYSNANNFYKPDFVGKTFSVDINFGRDGPSCGCNLNFYLVDMPVASPGNEGDHYCDAQCFAGLGCCAEFDMNEGNMDVQQITNHACTHNYGDHPDWACNKWGDPELKTHGSTFGIGAGHTIDSTKPFTFSQKFEVNGDDFTFITTFSQEGREVSMTMGPGSAQLNAMLQVIKRGMAFVTGYWSAPDMNWMDGETCGSGPEHCNMHPAYISNWRLTSNGGAPGPSPGPSPVPSPPSPPSPVPSPPAPAPAPAGGGKCCWGSECSNCKNDPSNWCNLNVQNCWACNGGYCKL